MKRVSGPVAAEAAGAVLRRSSLRAGVAIVYHAVVEDSAPSVRPFVDIRAGLFSAQLAHLASHYRVVPASRLLDEAIMRRRGQPFPVSVTLDDELESHSALALPLLEQQGLLGAFFVGGGPAAEHIAAAASASGHEVGWHGATHRPATELGDDEVRAQLSRRGDRRRPAMLAYPFGAADARVAALAAEQGFSTGFTTTASPVTPATDPLLIGRVAASSDSLGDFALQLVRVLAAGARG